MDQGQVQLSKSEPPIKLIDKKEKLTDVTKNEQKVNINKIGRKKVIVQVMIE